jgi:chorismate mutase
MSKNAVRGIRGATTCDANTPEAIVGATRELLERLTQLNRVEVEEIACAHFTATHDLDAAYPAQAARELGWVDVPLFCSLEIDVPPPNHRALPRCVRVLLLYNTDRRQRDMTHVYLREAQALQADRERFRAELAGDPAQP